MDATIRLVARILAYPLWFWAKLKRSRILRTILFVLVAVPTGVYAIAGSDGLSALVSFLLLGVQLLFGFAFMIIQFVGIFWFMSQTKTTIVYPGDEGMITWDDYWGNKPVQEALQQWTSLLVSKREFVEMGGTVPRGILLVGPPGTGKTYAAKALAGGSQVPFRGIEGSGFRGMFWGMDVLRMIQFINGGKKMAREHKSNACILYIDELEAIGARRGGAGGAGGQVSGGLMGGMMTSGALTRLLVMMDGMEDIPLMIQCRNKVLIWFGLEPIESPVILFIGSTNRPQDLDPALVRSGRFGKRIIVDPPDKGSRRELFEGYLNKIKHDEVSIEDLVQDTSGRTPADIASAVTEDAVRIAHFDDRDKVTQLDIEDALQEQLMGLKNPISDLEPDQKKTLAVHEAGHAIAQYYLREDMRIVRVSIIRRSRALGYMMPVTKWDIYATELDTWVRGIMVSLAGHVAVELVQGKAWTGAGSDFKNIKAYLSALAQHGFFDTLPTGLNPLEHKTTESKTQKFLKKCVKKTKDLLEEHRAELDALWEALIEKEDLPGSEAVRIIEDAQQVSV